jgi:predicted ATP-grasp superfamily ATP-dependent carboligase
VRWVLVSEGGGGESRAALAAVRALTTSGYRAAVTVTGPLSLAAASRYCARRVPTPSVHDDPAGYAAAVRAELARGDYLDVLCSSDAALLALERPVGTLLDKELTGQRATGAGFEVPPTRVFGSRAELLRASQELVYPIVVKPAVKEFLAQRVDDPDELTVAVPSSHDTRLLVQPFLSDPLRGVVGVMRDGEIVQAAHLRYVRVWPEPCGTVSAAVTTAPDEGVEASLMHLLEGYSGLFHVDLAGEHLLDVNPRVHAALPVAQAAGVNLVRTHCDLLLGRSVPRGRARPGVRYRWLEGDLRSLVRQRRRGDIGLLDLVLATRPRRKTVHSVFAPGDPGPSVMRARYMIRRLQRREPIPW